MLCHLAKRQPPSRREGGSLAQSKTLRVFQVIIVSRAASWSVHPPQYCYGGRAVALHRFSHEPVKPELRSWPGRFCDAPSQKRASDAFVAS